MKLHVSSFWLKLVFVSLCISTLPVLLLGLLAYLKALSMVEEKVQTANIQLLQQYQIRLEQMLRTVDRQVFQLANSNPVMLAVREAMDFRDFQVLRELQRDLRRPQTIDMPVRDVILVSMSGRWMINNSGFYPLTQERLALYRDYSRLPSWSFLSGAEIAISDDASSVPQMRTEDSILYIYPIPDSFLEPEGLLVVEIQASDLNKWIASRAELGDMMVLDSRLRLFAHSSGKRTAEDLSSASDFSRLQIQAETRPEGMLLSGEAEDDWLFYRKSDYNGWFYVSQVSRKQIAKDMAGISWLTVYACIGVLLCTTIVSLLLARRVYRPLRQLYQTATEDLPRPVSARSFDEIEVISKQINSLSDREKKLAMRMESQTKQLKDLFFLELLQGKLKEQDIRERTSQHGLARGWKSLHIIVADIDTLGGTQYREQDRNLLLYAIGNMIQEIVPPDSFLHTFDTDGVQVAVIGEPYEFPHVFRQAVHRFCWDVRHHAESILKLQISFGISSPFCDLALSRAAYLECLEALKYRIHFGEGQILAIEDLELRDSSVATRPDVFQKELVHAIKMADDITAKAVFRLILEELASRNASYKDDQLALLWLLLDVGREVLGSSEALISFGTRGGKPLHERIAEMKTAKEREVWFEYEVLQPLIREYESKLRNQYKNIAGEMVRLIETHYDTNLTLEFCATRLNYSPDYLKRVFRKATGMNFSDYIAQYRLKLAKQWLIGSEMNISDIAEKLQYSNLQNFSRYFRKMEGLSPSEFRLTNRRAASEPLQSSED